MSYLLKFNILNENQFGFQQNKSTSHGILNLVHEINSSLKNKDFCTTIFLDLAKAFDTVDHCILLGKLEKLGIRGPLLHWFKSYLSHRYQCVSIDGVLSEPVLMKFGVPQGSVLGPLLFLIFINDITKVSNKFHYTLFADYTCITANQKTLADLENLVKLSNG